MTIKTIFSRLQHFLRIVLCCATLCSPATSFRTSGQGIGFHGMDYKIDDRTSYDVFDRKPATFNESFNIGFDLQTRPPAEFGYFFRVKDNSRDRRIWNLSYDSRGDSVTVRLNEEGRRSLIKATIPHEKMKHLHWQPVRVEFDLLADSVSLSIADTCYKADCDELPDHLKASIEFGRSDHIIDVPSFAIRNLTVSDKRKSYHFALDQSDGNEVWDDRFRVHGEATNPEWLINEATTWKSIGTFSFPDIAGASYNGVRKEFYYFTRRQITVFSLMTGNSKTVSFKKECPVEMKLGNNFISEDGRYLYCYELFNDEKSDKSASAARLDIDSGEWQSLSRQQLEMPLHHHCSFFNPVNGHYTILGGFGNMMYNGNYYEFEVDKSGWVSGLDRQGDYANGNPDHISGSQVSYGNVWKKIEQNTEKKIEQNTDDNAGDEMMPACSDGEMIYPRYFTSAGTDGKYVYVYGGMGNECGEQVVGRRYFYDLHRVDPNTFKSELLWNCEWNDIDKVPVRSLYIDGDCFYTLCYPEYIGNSELYLYRFSLEDGSHSPICNSIPITSDKMRTNANLYLDRELGQFFTTVQVFDDDIRSTLTLWSLSYPPLNPGTITSSGGRTLRQNKMICLCLTLSVIFLSAVVAAIAITRRKRKNKSEKDKGLSDKAAGRRFSSEPTPDSISLFGDFTVIGHDGADITQSFTRQQILMLVLLIKRGENGMSSKRLSSIFWPDKEEDKVKNSRGVAINNLRKSLSKLDGASISYRNGRYYLELDKNCICDWFELLEALKESGSIKGNASVKYAGIDKDKVLGIISRGRFLKSIDEDIFDDFKEKADNMLLPLLHEALDSSFRRKGYDAVSEIGKMIMQIDPSDEATMQTIIRSLKKQKLFEEALVYYSEFCSEYKKATGTDFPHAFKEI